MDLCNSFLVPFSKFKTDFINSRAFIGTCTFRDVCHFIFIHRNVFTYVLWIDSETKRMCVSFCSINIFEYKIEIYMIEIVSHSSFFFADKYSIEIIADGYIDNLEKSYVVYFSHWYPSQLCTFQSLIQKVKNSILNELLHDMLARYSVLVSSKCLSLKFIPFDKRQHECHAYYRNNIVETNKKRKSKICQDLGYFSPETLKKMCLFFVGHYFPKDWLNCQMIPSKLLTEILNLESYIGSVNELKDRTKKMEIDFNNIPYHV